MGEGGGDGRQWPLGVPNSQRGGAWGSGWEPSLLIPLGCLGALVNPGPAPPAPESAFACPPLQVLHQVLAVTGLPRVPEEHDVWSEVQALQVPGEGGRGGRGERASHSLSHCPAPGLWALGQVRVQRLNLYDS